MTKLPKDKRDKIIVVGVGTLAAVGAIWFFLMTAQLGVLAGVRKEKTESADHLAQGQNTLKTKDAMEQEYEELAARLSACESGMAAPNDMYSWLFQTLSTFRAGYQVEIPQFSRETPAEVGLFPKYPYRAAIFSVRGTAFYHDFGKFLADFENKYPYIRVQNIEIDPGSDSTAPASMREKLVFKMDLLTLVRPIAP